VSAAGEKLSAARVANDPLAIAAAGAEAGPDPEVVIEAAYGWYWVVDLLQANGGRVHLANPGLGSLVLALGEQHGCGHGVDGSHDEERQTLPA
jgi:hypothetical protein